MATPQARMKTDLAEKYQVRFWATNKDLWVNFKLMCERMECKPQDVLNAFMQEFVKDPAKFLKSEQ